MANDLNQCNFIGRLGADPETRHAPNGDAICNFRIAVGWKTKEKEGAEWVRISAFGKLAEICGQYLKKGSQVFIGGKMSTRKWQDKEGRDQYTTEIRADQMQMLGSKDDAARAPSPAPSGRTSCSANEYQSAKNGSRAPAASSGGGQSGGMNDFDDDIPFCSCAASDDVIGRPLRRRVRK